MVSIIQVWFTLDDNVITVQSLGQVVGLLLSMQTLFEHNLLDK